MIGLKGEIMPFMGVVFDVIELFFAIFVSNIAPILIAESIVLLCGVIVVCPFIHGREDGIWPRPFSSWI